MRAKLRFPRKPRLPKPSGEVLERGWGRTTEAADEAWDWIGDRSAVVIGRSKRLGRSGAKWIKRNAPAAWKEMKQAARKSQEVIDRHDDEVIKALRLLTRKGVDALQFAAEHDKEIMAALGVLAIYQPQLAVVILAYGAGAPAFKASLKLIDQVWGSGKSGRMGDQDWEELRSFLARFRQDQPTVRMATPRTVQL